ncbi:MAG: DUF924 domain-containing protein [Ectothiorhodospiraceae bacterium]|nr:DUF924 domain-containing protein [Ectothiorhodospiraceae bacterium]
MSISPGETLDFWFGPLTEEGFTRDDRSGLWFSKSDAQDADIRARFLQQVEQALAGELEHWADSPQGRLALIITLDQFTRNIFRDTPRAFEGDPTALRHALHGIDRGEERALAPIQRVFLYLPLEHAEDLDMQDRSVERFRELEQQVPQQQAKAFAGFTDYAERHRDVIRDFGRFPHRNAILGRTSSPAEQEYLARPGSGF